MMIYYFLPATESYFPFLFDWCDAYANDNIKKCNAHANDNIERYK